MIADRSNIMIVGGGHTRFGMFSTRSENGDRADTFSFESLINEVTRKALDEAGLAPDQIDEVWMGSCSPGAFVSQELASPLIINNESGWANKPTYQTTAACASGSTAIFAAANSISAGRCTTALVIGVEKMSLKNTLQTSDILARCSYWPEEGKQGMTFPGLFAELGKKYRDYYKISSERYSEMLATVAATNYRNGRHNPLAQFGPGSLVERKNLFSAHAILDLPDSDNPVIADPLRLHDCSPISDGAAAIILTCDPEIQSTRPKVRLAGRQNATAPLALSKRTTPHALEAAAFAMQKASNEAGVSTSELDLIEVHDCFTCNQLMCLEAAGISKFGEAGEDYLAGRFSDPAEIQVNLSGGLKSKGHPVGATGVSMHYLAYRQLIGKAFGAECKGAPEHAGVLNIGGSGVINCASILERVD